MNNPNVTIEKLKGALRDSIITSVIASFLTVVLTLIIVFAIIWYYKANIVRILGASQGTTQTALSNNGLAPVGTENQTGGTSTQTASSVTPNSSTSSPTKESEGTVVDAVKIASPAVVSILVSKEVPKYDVSYKENDFGLGMIFQTPTYIQNGTEKKEVGSGSGFLISSDGMIVTNRHVVADTTATYEVSLSSGKKYSAKVLARDSGLDVAIIKISASNLPYLSFGDSDKLEVGQSVIAIGNALGEFKNTVSVGVVSGLSRTIVAGNDFGQSERLDKVIQTDAAINRGNSGGPLLDLSGEVIGINVATVVGSSNVGFALPINSVKSTIDSVKKTGKIVRPYAGLRYVVITPELKTKNNLPVDYGILITKGEGTSAPAVTPGSPAAKAGIKEGDIILEVNGKKINSDFSSLVRGKKVGDELELKVRSGTSEKEITLTLEQAPDDL
jgi:serine protease Do